MFEELGIVISTQKEASYYHTALELLSGFGAGGKAFALNELNSTIL